MNGLNKYLFCLPFPTTGHAVKIGEGKPTDVKGAIVALISFLLAFGHLKEEILMVPVEAAVH